MITKQQKLIIKNYMRTIPYYGCYGSLHDFLISKKIPKSKVSKLVAWAVESNLDRLTFDFDRPVF